MTVAELVFLPVAAAFPPGKSPLLDALLKLKDAAGLRSVYKGVQVEDPTQAVIISVWELKHSESNEPLGAAFYTALSAPLAAAVSGAKPDIRHVSFPDDFHIAASSPVTEIVFFATKDDHRPGEVEVLIDKLIVQLEKTGCYQFRKGSGLPDAPEGGFVGILGWDTVEAHISAVKPETEGGALVKQIRSVADISLKHWKLTRV